MTPIGVSTQMLRSLWEERTTPAGLFVIFLILNSMVSPFAVWLFASLKDIPPFKETILSTWLLLFLIVSILAFNTLLCILWCYWRSLPRFDFPENAVIFAPHYDSECADLVKSLFNRFSYEIDRRKSDWSVKPVLLSRHHKIANVNEAHTLLHKTGARLVVFGQVDQGDRDGEHVLGFKSISFSLRHRELRDIEKTAVHEDVAGALAYREFTAKGSNSYIEKNVVVENLTEVSLFFVALGLTLESHLDEAISILRGLYQTTPNVSSSSPHYREFSRAINRCFSVALDAKFTKIYSSRLVGHVTDRARDNDFVLGLDILNELLQVNPQKSQFPLRRAIFNMHFGNIDQAFKDIAKAKKLAPHNDPSPHFSMAFLCFWKGQFKRALAEYKKVLACTNHALAVYGPVLEFLQSFHQRYPDRHEFLFALGFMNQNFFDNGRAEEDYREFIDKAKGGSNFEPLVEYANEQLVVIATDKMQIL